MKNYDRINALPPKGPAVLRLDGVIHPCFPSGYVMNYRDGASASKSTLCRTRAKGNCHEEERR
jgi:hypothetical protein